MTTLAQSIGWTPIGTIVAFVLGVSTAVILAYFALRPRLSVFVGALAMIVLAIIGEVVLIAPLGQLVARFAGPVDVKTPGPMLMLLGAAMVVIIAPLVEEAVRMAFDDVAKSRGATPDQRERMGALFGLGEALLKSSPHVPVMTVVAKEVGVDATVPVAIVLISMPILMHTIQTWRLVGPLSTRSGRQTIWTLWLFHALYNFMILIAMGVLVNMKLTAAAGWHPWSILAAMSCALLPIWCLLAYGWRSVSRHSLAALKPTGAAPHETQASSP